MSQAAGSSPSKSAAKVRFNVLNEPRHVLTLAVTVNRKAKLFDPARFISCYKRISLMAMLTLKSTASSCSRWALSIAHRPMFICSLFYAR